MNKLYSNDVTSVELMMHTLPNHKIFRFTIEYLIELKQSRNTSEALIQI